MLKTSGYFTCFSHFFNIFHIGDLKIACEKCEILVKLRIFIVCLGRMMEHSGAHFLPVNPHQGCSSHEVSWG